MSEHMARNMTTFFVIYFISVICFANINSSASDDADKAKIEQILANIKVKRQVLEDLSKKRPSTIPLKSLRESTSDKETKKQINDFMDQMIHIEVNDFRARRDLEPMSWYMNIYNNNVTKNQLDLLETIQTAFLDWVTKKFQQDVSHLSRNIEKGVTKFKCRVYHALKRPYYRYTLLLIIEDMKVTMTSMIINRKFAFSLDTPMIPYKYFLSLEKAGDFLTYGRKRHLERVKIYAEAMLNMGKNVRGRLMRCEQSSLLNKNRSLFHKYRVAYAGDWLDIKSEIVALKNIFKRFKAKREELRIAKEKEEREKKRDDDKIQTYQRGDKTS